MDYDSWKLSSGQDNEKIFCYCDNCCGEIYEGEEYFKIDFYKIHEDCFNEFALKFLNPRREFAVD